MAITLAARKHDSATACRLLQAATACVSPAFQALFRVHSLPACDAFMGQLLALHQAANTFFVHQGQCAIRHASRCSAAAAAAAAVPALVMKSIELGGPHGLTLSVQPIVLTGSSPEQLMPALLTELTIRDAARPLLCRLERADRCTQGLDEIAHMFTADGCTVLYQNAASQAYLGHLAGVEDLIGARGSVASARGIGGGRSGLLQLQQPADATPMVAPTSWLHQLFALDVDSLEQMVAVTSQGGVWR